MPTAPDRVIPLPSAAGAPSSPPRVVDIPGSAGAPSAPDRSQPLPSSGAYVANFLETAFAGTNNDLRFTQADSGDAPTVQILMDNIGGNSVSVTGRAILVHFRQNFGDFFLTGAQVKTLIESSAPALALITVSLAAGNDGTGAVCQPSTTNISFGPTALSGGSGSLVVAPPRTVPAPVVLTPIAPSPVL